MEKEILTIEKMDVRDIINALQHIIENKGYTILEVLEDRIISEIVNAFDKTNECFFIIDFSLSGLSEDEKSSKVLQIKNKLEDYRGKIYIVSNHTISNDVENKIKKALPKNDVSFIERDRLIGLLKNEYPEFWKHGDDMLSGYEDDFTRKVKEDAQLLALKINSKKYEKILDITLQPSLFYFYDDAKTGKPIRKRINIEDIIREDKSVLIEGISGSGKSTLLKRIGAKYFSDNHLLDNISKNIPIFVSTIDLNVPNFDIEEFIKERLQKYLGDVNLPKLHQSYKIRILVDSIDEFGKDKQTNIVRTIECFTRKYTGTTFVIGTRQAERLESKFSSKIPTYNISNLNYEQIKKFIQAFVPDKLKSNSLIEGLRQNKILERIPITPLTLSLITLLCEENNYEIPATITDLYDNFHLLIHGRPLVSERLEFIDISFRERILSMYGLLLMIRENHEPMSKKEFIDYFVGKFKDKSPTIKGGTIEDALNYIIDNTGILYLKDTKWISFAHTSYMEYYASREIFFYERDLQTDIIKNFFDLNWQNVAVFYAGRAKDMPEFTKLIDEKAKTSNRIDEYLAVVQGCGYVLQALYLTDNKYKKAVILTVLDKLLECYESMKKMASDEMVMFRAFNMPILMLLNILHFYDMFNSVTLKEALRMSFNDLMDELKAKATSDIMEVKSQVPGIGFKLLNIGLTLNSKQLQSPEQLSEFILNESVINNSSLVLISNFSSKLLTKNKSEIENKIKKRINENSAVNRALMSMPMSKFRFSILDDIRPHRKVKLIVEGESDVKILEHAYIVLTNGKTPYWTIKMASTNGTTGSADSVQRAMEAAPTYAVEYEQIIGILDCDAAGIKTYRKLKKDFDEEENMSLKTHKVVKNVHILLLPVPGEMSQYVKQEQELNYFEIEHYFGHEYLRQHNMLERSELKDDIYKIRDKSNAKKKFAECVCQESDPAIFRYFEYLFEKIDNICDQSMNYVI